MKKNIPVIIAILVVAVMAVIDLTYNSDLEPDETYNIANTNIKWYYAGK